MNFKKMTTAMITLIMFNTAYADTIDVHYNNVKYKYDNDIVDTLLDDNSNGFGITYSKNIFTDYFQIDLSYEDLGESSNVRGNTTFKAGGTLFALGGRFNIPLYKQPTSYRFTLFGVGGVADGDFHTNLSGNKEKFSSSGAYVGGGLSLTNGSSGSIVLTARKFLLEYSDPIVGKVKFDPLVISLGVAATF